MLSDLHNYWLLIPLVLAIAIGWWLGRRESAKKEPPPDNLSYEYFNGLDYLLNERVDEAIESFIRALEINSDTIPAHIALAKLFRRKGDVERAIKLHQNLLARPDLSHDDFVRIQMALAKDYYAVGLLDRAENLLIEIVRQQPNRTTLFKALSLLIKLYEKEGEWLQALETAAKLTAEERAALSVELSHYSCELAEQSIKQQDFEAATKFIKQAEQYDASSIRASLLKSDIAQLQQQWRSAVKALKEAFDRDPDFALEIVPAMKICYDELNKPDSFIKFLRKEMEHKASTSMMLAVAEVIKEQQGHYAAGSYVTNELKKHPSVKGFNRLIDMHIEFGSESARESLTVLRGLTGQLELTKPIYHCNHCGFSGRSLHWQCPSCQKWGSTKPIKGLEGE